MWNRLADAGQIQEAIDRCGEEETRVYFSFEGKFDIETIGSEIGKPGSTLRHLRLSHVPIGPVGAEIVGKALIFNGCIQFLQLDSSDLVGNPYRPDYRGVKALAKGIEVKRSSLRYLNVADNDLQPEGCRILLGAVAFHRCISALDISSNLVSLFRDQAGVLALSYVLTFNSHLSFLNFSNNSLPLDSQHLLHQALSRNTNLLTVQSDYKSTSRKIETRYVKK